VAFLADALEARADHVVVAVVVLEVQELEGVAAAIDQIDDQLAGEFSNGLAATHPQAALAVRALALLGAGRVLGAASADVEDLVGQPQRLASGVTARLLWQM